jgi:hypothetical protein
MSASYIKPATTAYCGSRRSARFWLNRAALTGHGNAVAAAGLPVGSTAEGLELVDECSSDQAAAGTVAELIPTFSVT